MSTQTSRSSKNRQIEKKIFVENSEIEDHYHKETLQENTF